MASHPDLARLHQLVDIFSHKTLDAYLAYEAAQGQYLKELGVDQAASMETMRLLTLCTLAASAETLSYDAVAQALKVGHVSSNHPHRPQHPCRVRQPTISFDANSSLVKRALGDLCPLIKQTSIRMRLLAGEGAERSPSSR